MAPKRLLLTLVLLTVVSVSACTSSQEAYRDPVQYCVAIGTIDRPDNRYAGPASPEWITDALGRTLHLVPTVTNEMVLPVEWRCASGSVMACSRGLGMSCDEKADDSRVPSRAALEFCRAFPNIDKPLPNLDGLLSKYTWDCSAGWPHIIGLRPDIDAEGYLTRYWFRVTPGATFTAKLEPHQRPNLACSGSSNPACSRTATSVSPM